MHSLLRLPVHLALLLLITGCAHRPTGDDWQSMFDGETLTGWKAPDMSFWRVEDHAITGETTREHNPPRTQFIVWQGADAADFELSFETRIFGPASNSGMQFRSAVREFGLVAGYQADLDGAGKYSAGIWDESGPRNSLAARGQDVVIAADGTKTSRPVPGAAEALRDVDYSHWTTYHLKAVGPKIQLWINGILATELEDHETGKATASGVFAMAIISGEPMKVQFRNLRLKRLP